MKIDVIGWVKGWRLDKFLKKLFKGELNEAIKKYSAIAVVLLQELKQVTENPALKEVTDFIPGEWDNQVAEAIKEIVPAALEQVIGFEGLFDSLTSGSLTFGEKLAAFLRYIELKPETEKAKSLNGLAVTIAIELVKKLLNIPEASVINKVLVAVPAIFIDLFGKK